MVCQTMCLQDCNKHTHQKLKMSMMGAIYGGVAMISIHINQCWQEAASWARLTHYPAHPYQSTEIVAQGPVRRIERPTTTNATPVEAEVQCP